MRSPYILEIYRKAMRSYTPLPCQGNVVLFSGHSYTEKLRRKWFDLCGAKLTIDEVPGDHHTVLEEPNVGVWAQKLKSYLDAAQHG